MRKYILTILLILTSGIALEAKIEPRFKEKGVSAKYHKDIDAMVYSAKWGQGSHRSNPLDVKIFEYGDKAGKYANTSWIQVHISTSGNVYVGMREIEFFYGHGSRYERINLQEIYPVSQNVDLSWNRDTFKDRWGRQFRGKQAEEWAKRFIRISNTGDSRGENTMLDIRGDGAFSDTYFFTKKDKEGLRKLGEAWLKYFAEPQEN